MSHEAPMAAVSIAAETQEAQTAELESVYAKVSRRLLPILLLGYIVAYLDRVNVGFAKLEMLEDLHFSEAVYGLGAGIFFLGYFLFEVPSNALLHRLGARMWIARIMISWGVISAATALITTPTQFYAVRFVLGVAEAGFFPGVIYYLTQWFPPQRLGKVTAIFMTGVAISSLVGSVISGAILQGFEDVLGWAAWQWLFVLEAIPAVLIGGYIAVKLPNSVNDAPWLSAQEKALLQRDLAQDRAVPAGHSFADAFRQGRVWFACLIYFCAVMGLYGIGFWLPTIILSLGVKNPLHIGLLAAIPYTAAIIAMVRTGESADRHAERRWHVAIPAALGAVALVLSVWWSWNAVLALGALTLATAAILTVPPLFWSIPTAYLQGAAAAAGIALINSFGNLAGFVSPYVVGRIKDATGSTDGGVYLLAGFVFAAGVLVIVGVPAKLVNR